MESKSSSQARYHGAVEPQRDLKCNWLVSEFRKNRLACL